MKQITVRNAMINKKDISISSIVLGLISRKYAAVCEVLEAYQGGCKVRILRIAPCGRDDDFIVGTEPTFEYECCCGLVCNEENLRSLGFIDSDEKGWSLMYYFGDMKLLYHQDRRMSLARFRFKSSFVKRYVSISCHHVHELQNIMKFLTGGELVFTWQEETPEKV